MFYVASNSCSGTPAPITIQTGNSVSFDGGIFTNGYIDATEPFKLAKDPANAARLDTVLNIAAHSIHQCLVALLPILPLVLLPLLFLWRSHAWFGFSVTVCAAGAAVSSAALNVRERTPGRRRDFRTRYKGRPGRGFIELAVVAAWTGICALMVWLSPWR